MDENRIDTPVFTVVVNVQIVKPIIGGGRVRNIDALRMLPVNSFVDIVFDFVKRDCATEAQFKEMLEREFPKEGEKALQVLILQRFLTG